MARHLVLAYRLVLWRYNCDSGPRPARPGPTRHQGRTLAVRRRNPGCHRGLNLALTASRAVNPDTRASGALNWLSSWDIYRSDQATTGPVRCPRQVVSLDHSNAPGVVLGQVS